MRFNFYKTIDISLIEKYFCHSIFVYDNIKYRVEDHIDRLQFYSEDFVSEWYEE